jgi:hypothetical protein
MDNTSQKDSSRPPGPHFRAWLLERIAEDRAETAPPPAEEDDR